MSKTNKKNQQLSMKVKVLKFQTLEKGTKIGLYLEELIYRLKKVRLWDC